MTVTASLYHRFQRYRTLQTHHIHSLPLVILMPHSACNCRCVMCDIWKDNKNLKQLTEADISSLLLSLKKLGTRQVLMSGGEALLNPNFFRFCEMLRKQNISISLLSTGLTLKKNAEALIDNVHDIIVSLDGPPEVHDQIRSIPGAWEKLNEGVNAIKSVDPGFRITARTVIHKLNYRNWNEIVVTARSMNLDQISFLPADISSQAFNREIPWNAERQQDILPNEEETRELKMIIEDVIEKDDRSGFIAERPEKLRKIHDHYAAHHGWGSFPFKKCNAPWVSTVVEADGTIRPCFFHDPLGNIREQKLEEILNSDEATRFRKELDIDLNSTCRKCVCSLYLSPGTKLE